MWAIKNAVSSNLTLSIDVAKLVDASVLGADFL